MSFYTFMGWLLPMLAASWFGYKVVTWLFIKPETVKRFEKRFETKKKG